VDSREPKTRAEFGRAVQEEMNAVGAIKIRLVAQRVPVFPISTNQPDAERRMKGAQELRLLLVGAGGRNGVACDDDDVWILLCEFFQELPLAKADSFGMQIGKVCDFPGCGDRSR